MRGRFSFTPSGPPPGLAPAGSSRQLRLLSFLTHRPCAPGCDSTVLSPSRGREPSGKSLHELHVVANFAKCGDGRGCGKV